MSRPTGRLSVDRGRLAMARTPPPLVLQLTRAAYFGAAVGFLVAAIVWWFRRDTADIARRRLILVPVLLPSMMARPSPVH